MMRKMYTELNIGDVVHFYGARFEIYTAYMIDPKADIQFAGEKIMRATGKWLDGEAIRGYFGPEKDWMFQGNQNAVAYVE